MTWALRANVGRDAINLPSDVKVVQLLLNRFQPHYLSLLRVDGCAVHRTTCAIEEFQREVLQSAAPDGVVAPGSETLCALRGRRAPSSVTLAWGAKVDEAFKYKVDISGGEAGTAYVVTATVTWLSNGRMQTESVETRIAPRRGEDSDPDRRPADAVDRL